MENKICVITGCNTGIGKITAIELAKQNYEILMLVRDSQKSRNAFDEIKEATKSDKIKLFYVDLASLKSVKRVADEIKQQYSKIDVLINNAGVFKRKYDKSVDDFEMTLAVNYLAPFMLTNLLLPLLKESNQARIVNVSSEIYKSGKVNIENNFSDAKFNGDKAYANSKLLIIFFTKELAKRLDKTNVTVNSVHPGVVGTDVFREYPKWFSKMLNLFITKPEDGAKPSIFLATSKDVENITGQYFNKTKQAKPIELLNDEELSEQIWNKTESLLQMNDKKQA